METSALRALVKAAAIGTPHARLWPNGLGFDCHGTQYAYLERSGCWQASRAYGWAAFKQGFGKTPLAAKEAAGIGRSVPACTGTSTDRTSTNIVWGS